MFGGKNKNSKVASVQPTKTSSSDSGDAKEDAEANDDSKTPATAAPTKEVKKDVVKKDDTKKSATKAQVAPKDNVDATTTTAQDSASPNEDSGEKETVDDNTSLKPRPQKSAVKKTATKNDPPGVLARKAADAPSSKSSAPKRKAKSDVKTSPSPKRAAKQRKRAASSSSEPAESSGSSERGSEDEDWSAADSSSSGPVGSSQLSAPRDSFPMEFMNEFGEGSQMSRAFSESSASKRRRIQVDGVSNALQSAGRSKGKFNIVATNVSASMRDIISAAAQHLGGFTVSAEVDARTTHVISGSDRRTMSVLQGAAKGAWLLSPEWCLKSIVCSAWEKEDAYQLRDWFPAPVSARETTLAAGPGKLPLLFKKPLNIFIGATKAPQGELEKLVTFVGCKVTQSVTGADVILGTVESKRFEAVAAAKSVNIDWLFGTAPLTQRRQLMVDA